jgi:uncharacterized membrane protein
MKTNEALIQFAVITTLVLSNSQAFAATHSKMEKCYGVVKAGMNDCQTATTKCASSSTKDNQADAFVFLPQGMCNRIVGGKLTDK